MKHSRDRALRQDVRLLGRLLGDTLKEQGGGALFDTVERVRALSKEARAGSADADRHLTELLQGLSDDAVPVARAFAHFLSLANIAEQHHRVRRRRERMLGEATAAPRGSLEDALPRLLAAGIAPEAIHRALVNQRVEMVLTAHPTEVVRRTLIQKQNRIAKCLGRRDLGPLTKLESDELDRELRREITAIWQTDEIRRQRPTPVDEARAGLVVIENSLWHAVPRFLREMDGELAKHTGRRLPLDAAPVVFGSWMGGDRDGNPNVTPEITREVCLTNRWMAADLFHREIIALGAELSMTRCDDELRMRVGAAREPYRELLRDVRARLATTRQHFEDVMAGRASAASPMLDPAELLEPLMICHRSLVASGAAEVADGRLTDLLRRLACFGLTLVTLDVRQEASRHEEALDVVTRALGLGSYAEWSEAQRHEWLLGELDGRRPLIPPDLDAPDTVRDVLETFRVIAAQPPGTFGAYVISMAHEPSDILAVELLQKEARVPRRLRVVPLFETRGALERSGDCLRRLLATNDYRERIGFRQEVMIGYSDSGKEVGRLAANWALYCAQEDVVAACREAGVKVTLFHGRGGTVDRGGGPAHAAILSQPPHSVDGALRVTEQGEAIQARFGLPGIALRTMERYATAVLEATLDPPPPPREEWRAVMKRLADVAARTYRGVVWEDAKFEPYFRVATPEADLGRLNIGSRPAKRQAAGGLKSLRAIPWVFAWTQTRLLLPGWLGVGEALREGLYGSDAPVLAQMAKEWPFFHATLDLVEMVLAKADMRIAHRYDEALVPEALRPLGAELRERFALTCEAVLQLLGHKELLEENPVLRRSIDVRNPYVDPINLLQVEFLRRLREADNTNLHDALLVTINGIAAGMRNTG
jgi:phosphoenolpyruvate carboxylase